MSTSLDIMDIGTTDLTFNKQLPREKLPKRQEVKIPEPKQIGASPKRLKPKIKDIELTGSEMMSRKRGLNILGNYNPSKKQFSIYN